MPFPPFFRRLFGDNPVKPYKIRKELLPLDVDAVETFRKSLIGCLIPTTMATLPSCLGIPDGSLFLFEDYPELQEKYASGGFNGMLLESTASSEEKDAWRGKWIKHPQGLGLYAPRLQGLFLRNAGTVGDIGRFNPAGMPDIIGHFDGCDILGDSQSDWSGAFSRDGMLYGNVAVATPGIGIELPTTFKASLYSAVYGKNSTVMPASVDMVIGLYLGRTA